MKVMRFQLVLFDQLCYEALVPRLIRSIAVLLEVSLRYSNIFAENIRQLVTSRIEDKGATIRVNVLESDPRRRQITERIRGHVDGVRVRALLRTLVREDGLKGLRFPAQQ